MPCAADSGPLGPPSPTMSPGRDGHQDDPGQGRGWRWHQGEVGCGVTNPLQPCWNQLALISNDGCFPQVHPKIVSICRVLLISPRCWLAAAWPLRWAGGAVWWFDVGSLQAQPEETVSFTLAFHISQKRKAWSNRCSDFPVPPSCPLQSMLPPAFCEGQSWMRVTDTSWQHQI